MNERSPTLARQLGRSVVITAISSVIMTVAGLYLFYGVLVRVAPRMMPDNYDWMPGGLEWLVFLVLCLISGAVAVTVARGLARRIVLPITTVAEGARRLADGDLATRLTRSSDSLSELSMLIDDFNVLAVRLERASQAVTQWNAMIAHELRTPVTILRGRLQGLADGVFQPDPALFRSLEQQVISLSRRIDDLRTATLFDGGHLHLDLADIDLSQPVLSAAATMRDRLEAAGFTLELAVEPITCRADPERIMQALTALLENVRRHARPGPISVTLSPIGGGADLRVRDDGPGLPEGFGDTAFDPFMRHVVDGTPLNGTGLGLTVVRAIAEAHGGTASCCNDRGGACFVLTLPRTQPVTGAGERLSD